MKKGRLLLTSLTIILTMLLFGNCGFDVAPSTVSENIAESKQRNFFINEYQVDSLQILDKKKPFILQGAWMEKVHMSKRNWWGKETYETSDKSFQIVFKMADNSFYKNSNFMDGWVMYDEKKHPYGMDGKLIISSYFDTIAPNSVRFGAYLSNPGDNAFKGSSQIARFVLKKKTMIVFK